MKRFFIALSCGVFLALSSCGHVPCVEVSSDRLDTTEFRDEIENISETEIVAGNKIKWIPSGDAYFSNLLGDLYAAKKSINLETFIIREGTVATYIVNALAAKAREGVEVNVIFDSVGSRFLDKPSIEKLRFAGVDVKWYRPWWKNLFAANNRDHRKIIVIDGMLAYTGGAGIADVWAGKADKPYSWYDSCFKVTGPVVAQLQNGFLDNWSELSKKTLTGEGYFPSLKATGTASMQSILCDSAKHSGKIEDAYLLAINSAKEEIVFSMAYVCPPTSIKNALECALERNVKVTILTANEYTDSDITRRCGHNLWRKLIKKGIKVYEYQPTMLHSKVMVVDEVFTVIGAANLDYRSLRINDENNLHVFDSNFASQQLQIFARDLKHSKELTLRSLQPYSLKAFFSQSQL